MSPEQCRATSTVDARSDIYSIGVIAYEMLAGERPFSGGSLDVMVKQLTAVPQHLAELAPSLPRDVANYIMSALEKDPEKRPQRAALFASTLRAKAEGAGSLLRRAVAICSENLPTFLRLFLVAYTPLFAIRVVKLIVALTLTGVVPDRVMFAWDVGFGTIVAGVATFLAAAVSRGVASLALAQLIEAPLQKVRIKVALGVLTKRVRPLLLGSVAFLLLIILPLSIFIESLNAFMDDWSVVASGYLDPRRELFGLAELAIAIGSFYVTFSNLVSYSLFPIALLVEGKGVRDALRRSKEIVARGRSAVTTVTALGLLEFIIPITFSYVFVALVPEWMANKIAVVSVATVCELVISPIESVAYAMLYLKLRQAGGESLDEMIKEQLVQQDISKARWMQRMLRRVASGVSESREP
jgi:hypothetical protein